MQKDVGYSGSRSYCSHVSAKTFLSPETLINLRVNDFQNSVPNCVCQAGNEHLTGNVVFIGKPVSTIIAEKVVDEHKGSYLGLLLLNFLISLKHSLQKKSIRFGK